MPTTYAKEVVMNDGPKSLKELLDLSPKTLREVAVACGVTHPTVIRWRKKNRVPPKRREAFARALDVDVGVVDSISRKGSKGLAGYVSDREAVSDWRDAVMESQHSEGAKHVLNALPLFIIEPDWTAHVTKDALVGKTHASRETVDANWQELVDSPFVERVGPTEWAFKLRIPDEE